MLKIIQRLKRSIPSEADVTIFQVSAGNNCEYVSVKIKILKIPLVEAVEVIAVTVKVIICHAKFPFC